METFEDGGILYEDLGNGQVRVIGPAQQASPTPVTLGSPRRKDAPSGYTWNGSNLAPIPGGPADKPDEANKPPAGYRWTNVGGLEPIPGGPADKTGSGAKTGKPMRQGDADKLAEQVDSYAALKDALGGFQDDFAGNTVTGRLENWAQGAFDVGTPGQRQWWANFYAADNLIRNSLFGASLTDGEKQAYAQTTVDPSMSPTTVKKNIEERLEIARKALSRRTGRLRATFNNEEIDAAVGEFVEDFSPNRGAGQLRDKLGIQVDPAMIAGQQGGGERSLGNVGGPLYGDPAQSLGGQDVPQDIAMRGGVPMGAGGPMSDLDVRWGGGSNGEFDRAGWLEKNRGWTENDATTYIAILNANKGKKLSAEQLMQLMASKGIPIDRQSTIDGIKADAANLGNGKGWNAFYPPEQADWDKRVEELKGQRKDDVVNPVLRGAADTGLMGQADKIFALTDTLSGGTYQDNLNERYATNAADNQVNPYLRTLGQVAGGIGPSVGLAKGTAALGTRFAATPGNAGNVIRSLAGTQARAGTTANALYGAGYGATQDSNPLRGAAIGAIASLGGDKAGQLIGRTVAQSNLIGRGRNAITRYTGGRQVAEFPKMSATDNMVIGADPAGQVLNKLSTAKDLQVPMTLADATPEFRALAGATARRSPTARGMAEEAFVPRSKGQYDRLIGAIDRDLGPTANVPQYSEDLIKQAQSNSRPFYDEAFSAPGASSVDISGIAKTPMGQQGISNAYNSVRNTLGPDGQPIDATSLGFDIAEGTGEATINRVPSFETLDYFKKGLDDVINSGFDPMTKQYSADARAAIQLKQNLVSQIDNVNPAYTQARQAYAGPAGEREALRLGQSSGNMTPDQMQYAIKDFSPEKRAQFALGDRSRMADRAASVRDSGNPWEAAFGSPKARDRLAISHPNASPRFGQQYGMEKDMTVSANSILGNSMTAERQLADQAFAGNMMSDVAFDAVTTGTPLKTGATLLGRLGKDELGRFGAKKKADALAPILFDTDIDRAIATLAKVQNKPKVIKRAKGLFGRKAAERTGRGLGMVAPLAAIPFFQE
jgi:hypothetical protein